MDKVMWAMDHARTFVLFGLAGLLMFGAYKLWLREQAQKTLRRDRVKYEPEEQEVLCQGCSSPRPRYRAPQIVEVRSLVEVDVVDALLLRLGFHRDVKHAIQVDYGDEGGSVYCKLCAAVARAEGEKKLQEFEKLRAEMAVNIATMMGEFNTFGMKDRVQDATKPQRDRIEADRKEAEKKRIQQERAAEAAARARAPKEEERVEA